MPVYTLVHAALLVALGIGGYYASDRVSVTALIPAAIGAVFAVTGALALAKPTALKHAMHAAATLALITFVFTARGVAPAWRALNGEEVAMPMAAYSKATAAFLSAVFLGACVKSFRDARIRRQQGLAAPPTA